LYRDPVWRNLSQRSCQEVSPRNLAKKCFIQNPNMDLI
jgi:hypothetical protein